MQSRLTMMVAAAALACAPLASAQLTFTDVTESAGVDYMHYKDQIPESGNIGAGAVWFDYDGDGDWDLFATQSSNSVEEIGGCNKLFRNEGDGSFTEVANAAGLAACDDVTWAGASADYDRDGDVDLFMSNHGQNRLFRNQLVPDGVATFVDVTPVSGMDDDLGARNTSAAWGDFNQDGFPDLYVGGYMIEGHFDENPRPDPPVDCWDNYLWMNDGDGTFTDIAAEVGVAVNGCNLAVAWTDYDSDGDLDLNVGNDFGAYHTPNRLYRNDGEDPTGMLPWLFTDVSTASGMDIPLFCMGIGVGDIDNDGDWDYYYTSAGAHALAVNDGNGTFTDMAFEMNVDAVSRYSQYPSVDDAPLSECFNVLGEENDRMINFGWGNAFADYNNDGDEDLYVVQGFLPCPTSICCGTPPDPIENLMYNNLWTVQTGTATFAEVGAITNSDDTRPGRALAIADYDGDGWVDLYVGNVGMVENGPARNTLLRNDGGSNTWLAVRPVGTVGDPDGIGAKVTVVAGANEEPQYREVSGGTTFLSQNATEAYFGFKSHESATLIVEFLGAPPFEMRDVAANQHVVVTEPTVAVEAVPNVTEILHGETLQVEGTLTNRLSTTQAIDFWIDHIGPDGTMRTILQRSIPMPGDRTGGKTFNFPINDQIETGANTLVFRVGNFPDEVNHQAWVDIEVLD